MNQIKIIFQIKNRIIVNAILSNKLECHVIPKGISYLVQDSGLEYEAAIALSD